jgi:hypothetical protein
MKYIEWTLDSINEWLEGKVRERGVHEEELLEISEHIRQEKYTSMLDLGTFQGVSGYIIGTSSPKTKHLVSIDWVDVKRSITEWDPQEYGMYLPKDAIFIKGDFRDIMDKALKGYRCEFAFIDDGHGSMAVAQQLQICYDNKVDYVILHDTNMRKVRRGMKYAISRGLYDIVKENNKHKGIIHLVRYYEKS